MKKGFEQTVEIRNLRLGNYVIHLQNLIISFLCCRCNQYVVPDKISIGPHHVYVTHCGVSQEVENVF
jgi:hypothetical protein